jgi:hypothetical protein
MLLELIYRAIDPPYSLPLTGGLMDQPPAFVEALNIFKSSEGVYRSHKEKVRDVFKELGALPNGK